MYLFTDQNKAVLEDTHLHALHPQVYAYDPTMGKTDHQRSEKIHFFATGISNYKGTKLLRMNNRVFMSRVS